MKLLELSTALLLAVGPSASPEVLEPAGADGAEQVPAEAHANELETGEPETGESNAEEGAVSQVPSSAGETAATVETTPGPDSELRPEDAVTAEEAAPPELPAPAFPVDADFDEDAPLPFGPGSWSDDPRAVAVSDEDPRLRKAKALRGGGIAALVSGAALIGGAIAMGTSDPTAPAAGNSGFEDARNRAAWTMGVPGIAMFAGGVAMVTVGAMRVHRLQLGPEPNSAGLQLRGRF